MLDPDKVRADISGIRNCYSKWKSGQEFQNMDQNEFETEMTSKYSYLAENAKTLFGKCCTGDVDDEKINYMISMMRKILKGSKTEHDASVKIGQKLVDEYVLPLIKDKPTKK